VAVEGLAQLGFFT